MNFLSTHLSKIKLFILSFLNHSRVIIPFRCYLVMLTMPIVCCILLGKPELQFIDTNYKCNFIIITIITFIILLVYRLSQQPLNIGKIKDLLSAFLGSLLDILSISVILLLIYIELGSGTGSVGGNLALCAAIVAFCATLYNVQRTSKQASTKNRQDWITNVRFESAEIISQFDQLKALHKAMRFQGYKDSKVRKEQFELICKALISSCTKVRMLINPSDVIAPILIAQLDTIADYCVCALHQGFDRWCRDKIRDEHNDKDRISSIDDVSLRKSFMPWVLVLLKVEWERVREILESREETKKEYYSKDIYKEWLYDGRYEVYGLEKQARDLLETKLTKEEDEKKKILNALFPGFCFSENTKETLFSKTSN